MCDITTLLKRLNAGNDTSAANELWALVYNELHNRAVGRMKSERPEHTLQPTALVHEAWLKLCGKGQNPKLKNRSHFFAVASSAMREILVDHARKRQAQKRGVRLELSETKFDNLHKDEGGELALALHEALTRFAKLDEKTAKLAEMRLFAGMTMEEAAEVLGIKKRTAERCYNGFLNWFRDTYKKKVKAP